MKLGIVADMHLAYTSSILPIYKKDSIHTTRLQYMIDTVKWYTKLFEEQGCDYIINLGDLTDSNILRSEEITALAEAAVVPSLFLEGGPANPMAVAPIVATGIAAAGIAASKISSKTNKSR